MVQAIHTKIDGIIERFEGHVLGRDDWGKRKLAYPIARNSKGHYTHLNYVGPTTLIAELERVLRLDANLLRFLTVRLKEDVDAEARLAELADAAATQAAAQAAAAEAAESSDSFDSSASDSSSSD